MVDGDTIKRVLKGELGGLQALMDYLEDRGSLSAKEYWYCQARLRDTIKELKHLERCVSHR